MKKLFVFAFVALLCLTGSFAAVGVSSPEPVSAVTAPSGDWSTYAASSFAGGSGTSTNPYRIATAEQLAYLAKLTRSSSFNTYYRNKYYELTADIDLSAHQWDRSIGSRGLASNYPFSGFFEGNNHVITGLYGEPLFGKVYAQNNAGTAAESKGQYIQNIIFKNFYVTETSLLIDSIGGFEVSGIIAYGTYAEEASGIINTANDDYGITTISRCVNYASVENTTADYVGGIINFVGGIVDIAECANYGTLTANYSISRIGGIVGFINNYGSPQLLYCANYGDIYSQNNTSYIGGLCGDGGNAIIAQCLNAGKIGASGTPCYAGYLVGEDSSNTNITNCCVYSTTSSLTRRADISFDNYFSGDRSTRATITNTSTMSSGSLIAARLNQGGDYFTYSSSVFRGAPYLKFIYWESYEG